MDLTFNVQQILQRYADKGAFHAINGYDDLLRAGVQGDFILSLLDLFEDERSFDRKNFKHFPLTVITDYIRRTHKYYLTKKLPEIEQNICLLFENYQEEHPLFTVLKGFYHNYRNELERHIADEERYLLPYIDFLQAQDKQMADLYEFYKRTHLYSLRKFKDGHHDLSWNLNDLRDTILKYQPPATNQTLFRVLLLQLETFQNDLTVHSLVEDHVLLPGAIDLEYALMQEMERRSRFN